MQERASWCPAAAPTSFGNCSGSEIFRRADARKSGTFLKMSLRHESATIAGTQVTATTSKSNCRMLALEKVHEARSA